MIPACYVCSLPLPRSRVGVCWDAVADPKALQELNERVVGTPRARCKDAI